MRALEENSSRMESMLCNMKREMDELRNAVKDRAIENLDGMIWRTNSPFTTEVLNHPLPPKFCLPQLESFDSSRDPLDHIEFQNFDTFADDPKRSNVQGFPNNAKGRNHGVVWQATLRHYCELLATQQGFCLSFHWRTMTQEANRASSQHTPSRGRIAKAICDALQ